jgi:hypothetical protein
MSTIANSYMSTFSLAAQSGFTVPTQFFSFNMSSLHHLSTRPVSSPVDVLSLRYESYKISQKAQSSLIDLSPKLQYLSQSRIFFQAVYADRHQTLASTISIVNGSNRKTSIEQGRSWLTWDGSYTLSFCRSSEDICLLFSIDYYFH